MPYVKHSAAIVRVSVEGLHCWPGADAKNKLNAFLFYPHRHVFNITAEIPVTHEDRQVEFFDCRHEILKHLENRFGPIAREAGEPLDFGQRSCETIAGMVAEYLVGRYDLHEVTVEVQEDEESSGKVTLTWQD